MDHQAAVRLQAGEKYVLGELTPELREEFEEHYFDCAECAADLKALMTFVGASREVLRERPELADTREEAVAGAKTKETPRRGWFGALWNPLAGAALAALAAIVVYQNFVTIPALKSGPGLLEQANPKMTEFVIPVAQVFATSARLQGATRGGGELQKVTVKAGEAFALDFDFTPSAEFTSYAGMLQDAAGHVIESFTVPGTERNKELHVAIPGGKVSAGEYALVIAGIGGGAEKNPGANVVQRIPFAVEVQP